MPLPFDATLPQLPQALDGAAMRAVFAGLLPRSDILRCDVDRVKYRPQRNCSVSYRLAVRDALGREIEQIVATRFCRNGEAQHRFHQARLRCATPSPAGPALSHVAALDMVAHWWPNDARLDATRLLFDDDHMRRHGLPPVVAEITGGRGRLVSHRTSIVQYVPELRVCARVELVFTRAPGAPHEGATVFAKADLERDARHTSALLQALHASPAQKQGRLRTPRPLAWQAAGGMHWQLAVPGRALRDVDPAVSPAMAGRVGAQLAALHGCPVAGLPALGAQTLHHEIRERATWLAQIEPGWQPTLNRLATWLQAGAEAVHRLPSATLHGDLHLDNILVDDSRLSFIDLDSACSGPAVTELGHWVADRLYNAVLDGTPLHETLVSCRAFLGAYAEASGGAGALRLEDPLLAWSVVHALLCKRAYRCVANLKPRRYGAVAAILEVADAIASEGTVEVVAPISMEAQ